MGSMSRSVVSRLDLIQTSVCSRMRGGLFLLLLCFLSRGWAREHGDGDWRNLWETVGEHIRTVRQNTESPQRTLVGGKDSQNFLPHKRAVADENSHPSLPPLETRQGGGVFRQILKNNGRMLWYVVANARRGHCGANC